MTPNGEAIGNIGTLRLATVLSIFCQGIEVSLFIPCPYLLQTYSESMLGGALSCKLLRSVESYEGLACETIAENHAYVYLRNRETVIIIIMLRLTYY